ncbi:patatin [Bacteroidia bacterium]|nr:patatin [Bacteroidia bacterium]
MIYKRQIQIEQIQQIRSVSKSFLGITYLVKRTLLLLFILLLFLPDSSAERKKVGLVLSGGGAKGMAHIGAIKVIEEAGIPIDFIIGTSMGSIVGGLYAIGYDIKTIDTLARTMDWPFMLSDKVKRTDLYFTEKDDDEKYTVSFSMDNKSKRISSGFVEGQNVQTLLTELTIGYHDSLDFMQFPIPFACISADILTRKEFVATHGSLVQAIRASMSIPGFFSPVRIDSSILVDGGIVNNFPVDIAKSLGVDYVIGVDLQSDINNPAKVQTVIGIIEQMTDILFQNKRLENIALTDVYIHPTLNEFSAASFDKEAVDTMIQRGIEATMLKWDELIELRTRLYDTNYTSAANATSDTNAENATSATSDTSKFDTDTEITDSTNSTDSTEITDSTKIADSTDSTGNQTERHQRYRKQDSFYIKSLTIQGAEKSTEQWIRKVFGIDKRPLLTPQKINKNVSLLYGTRQFSSISYRLLGDTIDKLELSVREVTNSTLNFGFRFDFEEMAAILVNTKINGIPFRAASGSLTARLSRSPYIRLDLAIENPTYQKMNLSYMLKFNDFRLYQKGKDIANLNNWYQMAEIGFTGMVFRSFKGQLGFKFEKFNYDKDGVHDVRSGNYFIYYALVQLETLDKRYFPQRGFSFQANYSVYTDNLITYTEGVPFSTISANLTNVFPFYSRLHLITTLQGRIVTGNDDVFSYRNFMGGMTDGRYMDQQIAFNGLGHIEVFDNILLVGRLNLRQRLWSQHYISLTGNYAFSRNDFQDFFNHKGILGWTIGYSYDSPIGPIDFALGSSTLSSKPYAYFNLGIIF